MKQLGAFVAVLLLMFGIGVEIWGVMLIQQGRPLPFMMLSWVVPIYMSANHLLKLRNARR